VAPLATFRGGVPAVAVPAGLLTVANGLGTLDLRLGTGGAATATPGDGTDCQPTAPALAAGGGTAWLAWTGAFCAASGPRATLVAPGGTAAALGPLAAPGALANVLLPTQLTTALAVRPDGSALVAYPGDGTVLAWPVGDAAPIELARTGERTSDTVLAAAEPTTGRVWVAWRDPVKGTLFVRRSGADGRSFGSARAVPVPLLLDELEQRLGQWTIVADDDRLVVAFAVPGSSGRAGSAWYTDLR
jgi:hypothetical protein